MKTQYTPGPWKVVKRSDFKGVYDVCSKDITDEQDEANARLIAAAPELLEALRLILPLARGYSAQRNVKSSFSYILQAEQAIAKAEGRE